MPPRAIEQFADIKTGYVAESISPVLHPRSKVVTGIKVSSGNEAHLKPLISWLQAGMPKGGLEPPRPFEHNALNVACLPISPLRLYVLWTGIILPQPLRLVNRFSRPLCCQSVFHIASHFDRMRTSRLMCRSTASEEVPEDVHSLGHHPSCAQRRRRRSASQLLFT